MDAPKGNRHNAGHAAPAKTLTKFIIDFIAMRGMLFLTDPRLFTLVWVAGIVVMLSAMGVFQ